MFRIVKQLQRTSLLNNRFAMCRGLASWPEHEVFGMPALSPTMEKGNIVSWVKKEGDAVHAGDVVCEIETDKATVDYEAQDDGFLAKILVPAGEDEVTVGDSIFVMVEDEDHVGAFKEFTAGENATENDEKDSGSEVKEEQKEQPEEKQVAPKAVQSGERVFASPLARKEARENDIDILKVHGTGPRGRVVQDDVLLAMKSSKSTLSSQQHVQQSAPVKEEYAQSCDDDMAYGDDMSVSEHARQVAQGLEQQKRTVPHYHLSTDILMDKLLQTRTELNASRNEDQQLSVNDFLIRAAALAMAQVPEANSSWKGDLIRQYHNTDINVIMNAGEDTVAPVLRGVNTLGLDAISRETRKLMTDLESKSISAEYLKGGTFTMSNMGMYGVSSLSAIVSPNQSCSLGVGTIEQVVVPNTDLTSEIPYMRATRLTATLACDHRVIDGAIGAKWLASFKNLVEHPLHMLL